MPMIARIGKIIYYPDKLKHTVDQYEKMEKLAGDKGTEDYECLIIASEEQAQKLLREMIKEECKTRGIIHLDAIKFLIMYQVPGVNFKFWYNNWKTDWTAHGL